MDHLQQNLKKQRRNTAKSARASARGNPSSFLKLAITTGVVLFFAVIFFVFNTFGETKINITLNSNPSLNDGLVVHWTFDGPDLLQNVADTSGNGNTGYLTGFTSTTTVMGKVGQALEFDGVNDYVYANPADQTGSFTISLWIKAGSLGQAAKSGFFATRNSGATADSFQIDTEGSDVYRILFTDSSSVAQSVNFGAISLNWQHLTATWDGTTLTTYMDGVLQNTGTFTYTGLIEEYNVGVNRGKNVFFNSQTDDFRLYNRALSADEVKRLYQQGATTYVNKSLTSNPSLNDGLVGHWTFDGPDLLQNVADSSGNGNTGYLTGFTSTTTVMGKVGQALEFDGVDDYVEVPNNSSLNPSNITISVWAKSNTSTWNDSGFLASKRSTYILHPLAGTTDIRTYIYTTAWVYTTCTASNPITEWNQYVFSWDGTTIKCYINGSQGTSVDPGGSINTGDTGSLFIGKDDGYARFFNGAIDDVRIYNRALSADEVKRLYQQGATTYINKTLTTNPSLNDGLVGHWTFDGPDLLQNVADTSGNGNTGYLTGFTSTTTVPGKIGQALSFDGVDDAIIIPDNNSLDSNTTLSLSAWVFFDGSGGSYQFIAGKRNGFSYSYAMQRSAGKVGFLATSGGFTGSTFPSGRWAHIVLTYDSGSGSIYLDGVLDATSTGMTITNSAIDFSIGNEINSTIPFGGKIDDVRLYNRALSATEVKRLYQQGATTYINKTLTTNPSLNDGLVGHWTFDGPDLLQNVADSSDNGNTGYLTGFTSTTTVPGKIGQGLSFDGVDDTVDVANSSSLQPTSFTLSAWAKSDTATWSTVSSFISKRSAFQLFENSGGTKVFVQMWDSDGLEMGTTNTWQNVSFSVSDITVWHHYVGVYDSTTGFVGLYVDGDLKSSVIITGNLGLNLDAGPLRLGQDDGYSTGRFFKGSLDDARVYNRALSADEVKKLYELGN